MVLPLEIKENNVALDQISSRHIVIVDDELAGRLMLGKILQQVMDNVVLHKFSHPEEALKWINKNEPDLIITDYYT